MSATLLLDVSRWDLVVDASGNIAVASEPYSQAQDAASAIRLFRGELWFQTATGVPYFEAILGRFPSISFMRAKFRLAALRVPGVVLAVAQNLKLRGRRLTGSIKITNKLGQSLVARF
jgi:hypothetical protein